MDPASLILGAVVLIKPVCGTIHDSLSSYRNLGKDVERLRLRFAVQKTRLESFERVLFDTDKFAPAMTGRLIDHLPPGVCEDVLGHLKQLYGILLEYSAAKSQYKMHKCLEEESQPVGIASTTSTTTTTDHIAELPAEERIRVLTLESKKTEAAQHAAVGWARKVLWVTMDRNSTEKLVREFETWADQIRALLEAAWWPLSFFETVERMKKLEADGDAENLGLLRGIGLRKLLVASPASSLPPESMPREIRVDEFVVTQASGGIGGGFDIGSVGNGGDKCLVEYKYYAARQGGALASGFETRQRVVQIASLLRNAGASDPGLKVLRCESYFEDVSRSRFGLVFLLLPSSEPKKLSDLLDPSSSQGRGLRPPLCARLRLAHGLALCLHRLHTYKWLHMSLRSENIIFLADSETGKDTKRAQYMASLDGARVVGFEYSRRESDFSGRFGEADPRRNMYRHPARWGEPTERFDKVHDIYALGVILFEIGLWCRVDTLDNHALMAINHSEDPSVVQKKLLRHAAARLGFYAGEQFRDIVVGCLTGTFQGEPVAEVFGWIVQILEDLTAKV